MLLLVVAILAPAFTTYIQADSGQPCILILNSYHKGLQWTDEEMEGITEALNESGYDSNIYVEYMDWKRYPSQENLLLLYEHFNYKYSRKPIDIIITTDDIALEFALKNRAKLFSKAPIVFCGVNETGIGRLVTGQEQVTGVSEIIDPVNTVMAALKMKPGTKEVYVVFDNSESGLSTGRITMEAIRAVDPRLTIRTVNEMSIDELLQSIAMAEEDSIVLITTYYSDYYGENVGFDELAESICKRSKVPVFHLYDFGLGNGAVGGSVLSGEEDGKRTGEIAVKVLNGKPIEEIPVETLQTIKHVYDYEQLKRFNIDMKSVPAGSRMINKPFSVLAQYRGMIITVIVIILLLIVFIFILLHYLRRISTMKKELQLNNDELVRSGSVLKEQYDELEKVQKELTSSEERYSMLFRLMLNGFIIFEPVYDSKERITDIRFQKINPAFERQSGFKAGDISGRTWREVYGFPNRNLGKYNMIFKNGEPRQFESYHAYNKKYYLISAFKISDRQIGVLVDDITEYKRAISQITTLNEELEQRVAERTEELQSAVNELEAFTYTVSHDLKSPIRAVDGYTRIIMEDYEGKLDEDAVAMLQNVRNISMDMIEMIGKLLQYSTTTKAPIEKEKIDIRAMIKSIFGELLSAEAGRTINLNVETGMPEVFADRVMLRQVIYNILSNAVKFTRGREEAQIIVGCTITSEEYVFYFKDNGVGFDMEYSRKLFGIFQRLHNADEFEGSGIGLVTVRKIIQRHGGRVWIEGRKDVGAEVYFTLPNSW